MMLESDWHCWSVQMNFQEDFRPVVFWEKRGKGGKKMRKGGARGPPAPQPGFAFAANPELNFRDVGEAEVRFTFL